MNIEKLFELYIKEREYQKCCFGEYKELEFLNLASFIIFIEKYVEEAKKSYSGKWSSQQPLWATILKEYSCTNGTAPIEAYEALIKIFALSGAALEAFSVIDPNEWRKEQGKKWKK